MRGIATRVCATCHQVFIVAPENIFKIKYRHRTYHFCGYNCYLHNTIRPINGTPSINVLTQERPTWYNNDGAEDNTAVRKEVNNEQPHGED